MKIHRHGWVSLFVCLSIIAHFTLLRTARAQEWTRFRGPNGAGVSSAQTIPARWSERDFNWKIELPGTGHSSPVLWGKKIFLTSTLENPYAIAVYCVAADSGRIVWEKDFPFEPYPKHRYNSFASSTPAVDGARLYVTWSTPERYVVRAFDLSGSAVWEQNLGPFVGQHGSGASPTVVGDTVIVPDDQDGPSFLFGLDSATGAIRWKIPQQTRHNGVSYSTPCLYQPAGGGAPQLIFTSWPDGVTAVDPESGQIRWSLPGVFDKRCVSSPILAAGLIVGTCGSGGGGNSVAAARPPGANSSPASLAYRIRSAAPYVPTGVAVGNLLFLWNDGGIVTCVQAASGKKIWRERVGGDFFSSPICVGRKLYCISTTGDVVVLEAGETFKILARNSLGELSRATPAVAGGRMYVRTLKHLYSIGGK